MLKGYAVRAAMVVLAGASLAARADDFDGGFQLIDLPPDSSSDPPPPTIEDLPPPIIIDEPPADTTAPVLAGPTTTTFEWQGQAIALTPELLGVTANDETDGARPVTLSVTSAGLGTTSVTASASDVAGNVGTLTFDVVVQDTIAPAILSVSADPSVLMKRNHKMATVNVTASVSDDGDAAPDVRIVSVTCIDNGEVVGPAMASDDWRVTDDMTVELRCERSGRGSGRIYEIAVACTDASGNTSVATVQVTVPHDSRGKKAK
jgi:hypothetical protein